MHEISDISIVKGFIEMYSLALTALAFIVYTLMTKRVTSFNLVLIATILLHIIHSYITRSLIPLFGIEEYANVVGYLWYLSFGITDVLLIFVCVRLVERYELAKDRASYLILLTYGFMASLQFIDVYLTRLGYNWFAELYSNGIVFSNILVTVIPCVMAIRVVLVRLGAVIIPVREGDHV